jgi:hypothetical protein
MGGTAGNDRLPVEAVGIGATWSIVDCDYVNQTPAKEIRTYTLRSIAHRVVVLTFRDVVSMDPAQRDLGSQKIGTETVHARLDRLRGTASGTYRVALASAFRSSFTQVTKVEFTFHLVSKDLPATPLVTRLVDTKRTSPSADRSHLQVEIESRSTIVPVRSSVAAALAMSDSHGTPSLRTRRKCSSSVTKPIVAPVMFAATGTV